MKLRSIESHSKQDNGILFDGALRPKLLNISFTSCFLINLDFLVPHIAQFDNIIVLPLLVFETLEFILHVLFLIFKQQDDIVLYLRFETSINNFIVFNNLISALIFIFFN